MIAAAAAAIACSACSVLFTTAPPDHVERLPPEQPVDCTSSDTAPIADIAMGTFQLARAGWALVVDDSAYDDLPITREADVAIGAGAAILFFISAGYGFGVTDSCRTARAQQRKRIERLMHSPPPPSSQPSPPNARASVPSPAATRPRPPLAPSHSGELTDPWQDTDAPP